jgi:hypothetical protein
VVLAIVWLVMTIATAEFGAYTLMHEVRTLTPLDRIMLVNSSELRGSDVRCPELHGFEQRRLEQLSSEQRSSEPCSRVVRIVDRGVILATAKARFLFASKEQFSGIELSVEPWSSRRD